MSVLPHLPSDAVQQSTLLVLRATSLIHTSVDSAEQQRRQEDLMRLVGTSDAWGLVIPFLGHDDVNVQFYGAHILGVKVVREWNSLGEDIQLPLRDTVLQLTATAIALQRPKMVLRKLYIAITSMALKLNTTSPPKWPDFLNYSLSSLQSQGANRETLLEFMTIAVEEVSRASKVASVQITESLNAAIPAFMETFSTTVLGPSVPESERIGALKCLQAWVGWGMTGNDLTSVVPTLLSVLSSPSLFITVSDVLQDILTASALAEGAGVKTLTEPLLDWISTTGRTIADAAVAEGSPNAISTSFCKLICALGDHSNGYIATKLYRASLQGQSDSPALEPRVQEFLRLMLLYTGFPGYYGVDEEDSELTLGFWYLLQESLWEVGEGGEEDWVDLINSETEKAIQNAIDTVNANVLDPEGPMRSPIQYESEIPKASDKQDGMGLARVLFAEVVTTLRRKITWPSAAQMHASGGWDAEQREMFGIYRRNVGDTLINACYVLRDKFLENLLNDMKDQLAQTSRDVTSWENVEATLFCIKAVHDALTTSNLEPLEFLFSESTMNALPQVGAHRVRWTMLTLIGEYASYFTTVSSTPSLLRAVNYTVTALPEPSLSLQASMSLKDLCDANRAILAPHINSFADLHRNVELLGPEEKSKVIESISSVISALRPEEQVEPIIAIVQPLLQTLATALNTGLALEESQPRCIAQLRSLTGCARGLTPISDPLTEGTFVPDADAIAKTRQDERIFKLREQITLAIESVVNLWGSDAEITSVLSDLIKGITATQAEESILSLSPQPLLQIIAKANQRQVTSTWLTLATILTGQLYPGKSLENLNPKPTRDAIQFVEQLAPEIMAPCLLLMTNTEYLESNPDVVQEFFRFAEVVALDFSTSIYRLPQDLLSSLLQQATVSLGLQERYSLAASCRFFVTLLRKTLTTSELAREADALMSLHGKQIVAAIVYGVAGLAPRSVTANLNEILFCITSTRLEQARAFLSEILFSPDFTAKYPMATQKAKETFMTSLLAARNAHKGRHAVTQFQTITRGLEGTTYGYVTI